MYGEIPLILAAFFIVGGLFALAWSADRFVEGSAAAARALGVSPFIIGMVVIGFGTCAPEFCVSVFSGASGHAGLSLGNAYGSCIFNIAGILGIAALVAPLKVRPSLVFVGAPLLAAVAAGSYWLLRDGSLLHADAWLLLAAFFLLMPLYCWFDQRTLPAAGDDAGGMRQSWWKIACDISVGLAVMVGASHFLVWGSVDVARALGVGELTIGLTIVAVGTSIPELAAAVVSARKGECELVLGNIVGSNLFNALCVVGTAGAVSEAGITGFSGHVIGRDLPMMLAASLSISLFGVNWRNPREPGRISRMAGFVWTLAFIAYMTVMVWQEIVNHG